MNNLVGDVKANPRYFYRYINSQKKDTQDIPPLKRKNGKGVAQSDLEKAEEFNGQLTDVFSKNEHTQVPLLDRSAPFMNDIAVSEDGVIKLLKGLNPSNALGPDELHPRVLKELATELGPVFAHLFQQSIDTGDILINDWAKILDNRGQVDTFILDLEKAFDTPPHELLKSKLFSYGIGGKTLKWIDIFLDNNELL